MTYYRINWNKKEGRYMNDQKSVVVFKKRLFDFKY